MAKQYKVIAGAFPYTQRNKVYHPQEILSGDELNEGDAEKAVADGFIVEIPEAEEKPAKKSKKESE